MVKKSYQWAGAEDDKDDSPESDSSEESKSQSQEEEEDKSDESAEVRDASVHFIIGIDLDLYCGPTSIKGTQHAAQ